MDPDRCDPSTNNPHFRVVSIGTMDLPGPMSTDLAKVAIGEREAEIEKKGSRENFADCRRARGCVQGRCS